MVKNIIDLIEASGAEYIGIRHLADDEHYNVGDYCRNSYDWDYEHDCSTYETDEPQELPARAHTIPRYIPDGTNRMKSSQSWKKPLTHPKYTMEILLSSAETVLPMVMTRAKSS